MTGIAEAILTIIVGGAVLAAALSCFPPLMRKLKSWQQSIQQRENPRGFGQEELVTCGLCLLLGLAVESSTDFVHEKSGFGGWASVEALTNGDQLSAIGRQVREQIDPLFLNQISSEDLAMLRHELNGVNNKICLCRKTAQLVYYSAKNWFTTQAIGASEVNWLRRRLVLERALLVSFLLLGIAGICTHIASALRRYGQHASSSLPASVVTTLLGLALIFGYYHDEIDYNQTVIGTFCSEATRSTSIELAPER